MRPRACLAAVALAAIVVPAAAAARGPPFAASYTGHGSGRQNGVQASGSASATGRGRLIGRSTLTGSAAARLVSGSCLSFNGRAVLKGKSGSIKLVARGGQACLPAAAGSKPSFSGRARVAGGTGTFAGARGTLTFRGSYVEETASVTISFAGTLTY
jgi:hypothetical protein